MSRGCVFSGARSIHRGRHPRFDRPLWATEAPRVSRRRSRTHAADFDHQARVRRRARSRRVILQQAGHCVQVPERDLQRADRRCSLPYDCGHHLERLAVRHLARVLRYHFALRPVGAVERRLLHTGRHRAGRGFRCDRSLVSDRFYRETGLSRPGRNEMIGDTIKDPTLYRDKGARPVD